jgi:hypothetical protein
MTNIDPVGFLVASGAIGAGIGYTACLVWEWRKARKRRQQETELRQEIASLLVKRLQALRRFRVVK